MKPSDYYRRLSASIKEADVRLMAAVMSEQLKPCPLCGAMPDKLRTGYMCSTLGCALQENTVSEKDWNTRPIEDALNARNAELEKILDLFVNAGTDLYHRVKAEWFADAQAKADWKELIRTYKKDWVI